MNFNVSPKSLAMCIRLSIKIILFPVDRPGG